MLETALTDHAAFGECAVNYPRIIREYKYSLNASSQIWRMHSEYSLNEALSVNNHTPFADINSPSATLKKITIFLQIFTLHSPSSQKTPSSQRSTRELGVPEHEKYQGSRSTT